MEDHNLKVEYVPIASVLPYVNNARKHGDDDVDAIMSSIREFGFNDPIGVWRDIIVEGHGRLIAAKRLGLETVPVIRLDHLTDDQRKAYSLAHNRTAEFSEWDFNLVKAELSEISSVDMSEFRLDEIGTWFDKREMDSDAHEDGNEEYNEFVDKFKPKKTTDDCYTPENIYNAVAGWVEHEYGVNRQNFVRPFYPGGNFEKEKYKKSSIVVDNPPFSILAKIIKFYTNKGIKFFLFAPALTLFSSSSSSSCAIPVGISLTYDNGALVNTSFLTNMEDDALRIRTAPDLYQILKAEDDINRHEKMKDMPNYIYPDYVITAARASWFSKHGVNFRVRKDESERIGALDSMKEKGAQIFGSGYLLSEKAAAEKAAAEKAAAEKAAAEKAAAEKAAAEKWDLSDREMEIVRRMSEKNNDQK